MTISSSAASRKYFEKSSFSSARATSRAGRAFLVEPRLGLLLGDDCKDFDRRFCNVIEHPHLPDAKSVLWPAESTKPLNAALADSAWFVSQVTFESVAHPCPIATGQPPEILGGLWCQDNLESHSGQMIARSWWEVQIVVGLTCCASAAKARTFGALLHASSCLRRLVGSGGGAWHRKMRFPPPATSNRT